METLEFQREKLLDAHKYCRNNRPLLLRTNKCGCFYCKNIFTPEEIREWLMHDIGDKEGTAICPHCKVDSVIPETDDIKINARFLHAMHNEWFQFID